MASYQNGAPRLASPAVSMMPMIHQNPPLIIKLLLSATDIRTTNLSLRDCLVSQSAGEHEGFSVQRRTTLRFVAALRAEKAGVDGPKRPVRSPE